MRRATQSCASNLACEPREDLTPAEWQTHGDITYTKGQTGPVYTYSVGSMDAQLWMVADYLYQPTMYYRALWFYTNGSGDHVIHESSPQDNMSVFVPPGQQYGFSAKIQFDNFGGTMQSTATPVYYKVQSGGDLSGIGAAQVQM